MGKHRDYTKFSKENTEPAAEVIREDKTLTEIAEEIENEVMNEPAEVVEEVKEAVVEPVTEPVVEPEKEPVIGIVTDCVKLNVRAEASAKSEVVAVIDASTELVIIEEESTKDFFKICTASGIEGYCMKKFVTIIP